MLEEVEPPEKPSADLFFFFCVSSSFPFDKFAAAPNWKLLPGVLLSAELDVDPKEKFVEVVAAGPVVVSAERPFGFSVVAGEAPKAKVPFFFSPPAFSSDEVEPPIPVGGKEVEVPNEKPPFDSVATSL